MRAKRIAHNRWTGPEYVVDPVTGCWMWQHSISSDTGYAIRNNWVDGVGSRTYAHREYYEKHVGPIPDGLVIDHLCRVHACVNPSHLEPVTSGENILRGESNSAQNARKTHCLKGHALSGDNLYLHNGKRNCKACQRDRDRAVWKQEKAAFANAKSAGYVGTYRQWRSAGRPEGGCNVA